MLEENIGTKVREKPSILSDIREAGEICIRIC